MKRKVMYKAWSLFRRFKMTFSEALRMAWAWLKVQAENAAKVKAEAEELGIDEEYHTWAGWQALGRMVKHGESWMFRVMVKDPTTKSGTRVQPFFTYGQTEVI